MLRSYFVWHFRANVLAHPTHNDRVYCLCFYWADCCWCCWWFFSFFFWRIYIIICCSDLVYVCEFVCFACYYFARIFHFCNYVIYLSHCIYVVPKTDIHIWLCLPIFKTLLPFCHHTHTLSPVSLHLVFVCLKVFVCDSISSIFFILSLLKLKTLMLCRPK